MKQPHVLLVGDSGVWTMGVQALMADETDENITLVPAELPLTCQQLSAEGLMGVITVCAGYDPCPEIISNLIQVWKLTSLPQVVFSAQLGGLFRCFPGVRVTPLHAPLARWRKQIRWIAEQYLAQPPAVRSKVPLLPTQLLQLLQVLCWRSQGLTMAEVAARWQVSVCSAYARWSRWRQQIGISTPAEYAAVCAMSDTLLQLCYSLAVVSA